MANNTDHTIDMSYTCVQDPQSLLSRALEQRNINGFKKALEMDADPVRMDPKTNISLFEKALQTSGCSEFVEACINRGCSCDYINRQTNKAPINYATDSKDPKIIFNILQLKNIPVNMKYSNLTPLNSLAKNLTSDNFSDTFECTKLLIDYGADPNIPDQGERTPIIHIMKNKKIDKDKKKEMIKYYLDHSKVDLDSFRDGEARLEINKQFPDLQIIESITAFNIDSLMSLLNNRDENKFIKNFNEYHLNISDNDNKQNVSQEEHLQLALKAIKLCLHNALDAILATNININLAINGNSLIEIACIFGNNNALMKLLDDDSLIIRKHDNLLILVVNKLDEFTHNDDSNYHDCFKTLLKSNKIDINQVDKSGSSALHYAVKNKNEFAICQLLENGAYIGMTSLFKDLPITDMNPEILEEYFDSCITTNDLKPGNDNYEIVINYMNLVPNQEFKDKNDRDKMRNLQTIKGEMAPIEHIAQSPELRYLLQHPLITSFLFLKWHRLSIIFYINLILYSIFCASLVTFILLKFHNTASEAVNGIFFILSILGLIYMIIRESIQFLISPYSFIRFPANYLEIILIILTIVTLSEPNYNSETQRVFAVFTILLASVELCWLVGSLPNLTISTNMLMLRAVSRSFLKSFALYSIFIVTFSLCFYILFGKPGAIIVNVVGDYATKGGNSETVEGNVAEETESTDGEFNKFVNPFTAIIKTIVMLTGEFDAGDIDFNSFYSYFIFLLFVFFMSIVLFNLLNGLAVSDTQAIKSQAELNGSICRTDILSTYEKAMTGKNWKTGFIVNHQPFRWICNHFTNIFPDYISGNHIAILPNDHNKILIPKKPINEMTPTMTNSNGKSVLISRKIANYDYHAEKKLLGTPMAILPCCFPNFSGKCSEMDKGTVKNAINIIDKKNQNLKTKEKLRESEKRLEDIEEKLEDIFKLLKEISSKK